MDRGQASLDVACRPLFLDTIIVPDSFCRVYASDPWADLKYLTRLCASLPEAVAVRVTAPRGTDLTFRSRSWQVSSNTEVLTAPMEGSTEGTIVADVSLPFGRVVSPVVLRLSAGAIVDIDAGAEGDGLSRWYQEDMAKHASDSAANRHLCQVAVGGCAGARLSGVIMEDEAVRDTAHFCFGDNVCYGGTNSSPWHGGTVVVQSPRFVAL